MDFKASYKVENKMRAPRLEDTSLDYEIGIRFDRFVDERVAGRFAIKEILKEAERFFHEQYDDEYSYGFWRSEFFGKLMLSAVRICRMKQDTDLMADIRNSVYSVLSYQREDGYISAYRDSECIFPSDPAIAKRDIGWACNYNFNVWGQKYTLWALLEAAMLLDDEHVLACARKLADRLIGQLERLGARVKDTGVMDGMASSSIMKPMLLLYRLTADERYLAFCHGIAREFDREDGECPNIIRNALSGVPVSKWCSTAENWGAKAYEMMSCFDGIIELYRLSGTQRYLDAAKAYWELLAQYEANVLGSVGYCERFSDAKQYADAATEICDVIHWMRISYELFLLSGEGKYMEAVERAFLNPFLAGVYEDGRGGAFFVRSAGRHWKADAQIGTKYQHCCLNNVGRGFANMAEAIATEPDGEYYINSYIPATVSFGAVSIRVGLGYLNYGVPTITVRGLPEGATLHLRVPEWSRSVTVKIDGKNTEHKMPKDYIAVTAPGGDFVIRAVFDMRTELIHLDGVSTELPSTDYHVARWCDPLAGFCDRGAMIPHPMCIIRRGPLLLARTKRLGASSEDMFSGKTVYGKKVDCQASVMRHDGVLVAYRVKLTTGDDVTEYVMCDYASAANRDLDDARFFTVFV